MGAWAAGRPQTSCTDPTATKPRWKLVVAHKDGPKAVAMWYFTEAVKSVSWPSLYLKMFIFYHTFTFSYQFRGCKDILTFVTSFSSDL